MNLVYTYGGVVEANKDPLKLGRLKVRVPHVYGSTGSGSGFVATNDLPWAMPAGMPAGGSANSGGFSQLPEPGDKVWIRFLDGEPEKPIWEWGMQSVNDAKSLKLHSYKTGTDGSVGAPDRTVWTRYSHAIELNEGGIIESTSGGYRLLLNDSSTPTSFDGSIKLSTPRGNMLEIDDTLDTVTLVCLGDVNFQITTSFSATSFDYSWDTTGDHNTNVGGTLAATAAKNIEFSTAQAFTVDAFAEITLDAATSASLKSGTDITLTSGTTLDLNVGTDLGIASAGFVDISASGVLTMSSAGDMSLNFAALVLGSGSEPFVLGNQLLAYLDLLYTLLLSHTHPGVQSGPGSTGIMVPAPPIPTSALLSTAIFGR